MTRSSRMCSIQSWNEKFSGILTVKHFAPKLDKGYTRAFAELSAVLRVVTCAAGEEKTSREKFTSKAFGSLIMRLICQKS